ncbi:MAG: alpha/beta hydrolase [Bacillus sp. (in: firmicutes)]
MGKQTGKIEEYCFKSLALGEDVTLLIYLPANFSPLYKYTFCIVNDGKDYIQMGKLGRAADALLAERKIENMIFVCIPYKDVEDRRAKYHPKGDRQQAYIRFLAHELLPYLDDRYPGYGIGHGRALMGDSLAGCVSLMAALAYPNTFGRVILHSPYINESVEKAVKDFKDMQLLQIYQTVGTMETEVPTGDGIKRDFLSANRALAKLLGEKGFLHMYDEFEGGHTWKYWQEDLPRALEAMFGQ